MARSVDLIAHSWAGCRGDFIDALAAELYPLWMILLSLVVFDCVRSQRRINTCQGEIKLLMDGRLRWQGQDWTLLRPPWLLKSGMVLRLRAESGRHQHLWLAADSMEEAEWRELRRILLQQPISGQH
ncbi:putative inner membrane protein [Salmonella enterica subsp. enterica]|uniref:Putative inner membrane protein n=1 Tax=Salmonella enterica I TaxID=59201 RepID=A0A447N4G0_SALET|nr:putative inner membrane protein [Salmonella enterica subsp. enterica]